MLHTFTRFYSFKQFFVWFLGSFHLHLAACWSPSFVSLNQDTSCWKHSVQLATIRGSVNPLKWGVVSVHTKPLEHCMAVTEREGGSFKCQWKWQWQCGLGYQVNVFCVWAHLVLFEVQDDTDFTNSLCAHPAASCTVWLKHHTDLQSAAKLQPATKPMKTQSSSQTSGFCVKQQQTHREHKAAGVESHFTVCQPAQQRTKFTIFSQTPLLDRVS